MGITGLLPLLKDIQHQKSLACYSGQTIAVDGYAWLHRAVYLCALELSTNQPTHKYLQFFQRRVETLRTTFDITPYFVFDGDKFVSKSATENDRHQKRAQNREKGLKLLKLGQTKKAYEFLNRGVDVSPEIAKTIIEYLKTLGVPYLVAPYEADSQMVFLEKTGVVDAILSEDSDLLVFGAQKLLTKYNDKSQCVVEICRSDFSLVRTVPLAKLSQDQFLMAACLGGCDYTSGIPRIGIKKALQMITKHSNMESALRRLEMDNFQIPATFVDEYTRAFLSFRYARVFDPRTQKMNTLNEIPFEELTEKQRVVLEESIGYFLGEELHSKIAAGELNPITKQSLYAREDLLASNGGVKKITERKLGLDMLILGSKTVIKQKNPKKTTPTIVEKKVIKFSQQSVNAELSKSRFFLKRESSFEDMTSTIIDEEDDIFEGDSEMKTMISGEKYEFEKEELLFESSGSRSPKQSFTSIKSESKKESFTESIGESTSISLLSESEGELSEIDDKERVFNRAKLGFPKRKPLAEKNINRITKMGSITRKGKTPNVSQESFSRTLKQFAFKKSTE